MTEVTIQVPNGYELKEVCEGKWELVKKELTPYNILMESYQFNNTKLETPSKRFTVYYKDVKLLARLSAISQLQCVADYLNEGWKPDWNDKEEKWHIEWLGNGKNKLEVDLSYTYSTCGEVVFKTQELAEKAIKICGEDMIRDIFDM